MREDIIRPQNVPLLGVDSTEFLCRKKRKKNAWHQREIVSWVGGFFFVRAIDSVKPRNLALQFYCDKFQCIRFSVFFLHSLSNLALNSKKTRGVLHYGTFNQAISTFGSRRVCLHSSLVSFVLSARAIEESALLLSVQCKYGEQTESRELTPIIRALIGAVI